MKQNECLSVSGTKWSVFLQCNINFNLIKLWDISLRNIICEKELG